MNDIQRVCNINQGWVSNPQQSITTKYLDRIRTQTTHEQSRYVKLPQLRRKHNPIEKNILSNTRIRSYTQQSPSTSPIKQSIKQSPIRSPNRSPKNTAQSVLSQCILPSNKFTKSQNQVIMNLLLTSFKALKGASNNSCDQLLQSRQKTRGDSPKDKTFITATSKWLAPDMGKSSTLQNQLKYHRYDTYQSQNCIVDRQVCTQNGVRYPYRLFVLNKSRNEMLDCVMDNQKRKQSIQQYGDNQNQHFDSIVKENHAMLESKVQYKKQKKEMISRNGLCNAYYGLKALNKRSQTQVTRNYQQLLPKDSRFYIN